MSVFPITQIPLIVPGLRFWGDGNDPAGTGIQPADSTAIATFVDKSGNGFNFTQATGANQPLYKINIVGNKGSLLFDGATDYLERAYTALLNVANPSVFCIATVSTLDTTFRTIIGSRGVSGSNLFGFSIYRTASNSVTPPDNDNVWYLQSGSGNTAWNRVNGSVAVINTPTLTEMVSSSGTATFYVNGASQGTAAYFSQSVGGTTSPMRIGAGQTETSAGLFWQTYIHEILIYDNGVSAANRLLLERYAANKWGLAI